MFNKDVVAPGRMRRKIHNPRILLLDCPLEVGRFRSSLSPGLQELGLVCRICPGLGDLCCLVWQ